MSDVPGPVYFGRFEHSLDDKRRIALPKTFRDEMDEKRDGASFYLVPGFDLCLCLYTERRFDAFRRRFGGLKETTFGDGDKRVRQLRRDIFSGTQKLTPDKQGRISLPEEACRRVGIEREVVFLGVEEKIELWSPRADEARGDPARLSKLAQEIIG